jgi:hypothetical protein
MWPFHLLHTSLSGVVLVHGWRQHGSIVELIDHASHWEIAGAVALAAAFAYGISQLFYEARRTLRRRKDQAKPTSKAKRAREPAPEAVAPSVRANADPH